ncbi:MAG: sulfotransferase family protein [Gemmatimonadales bacterium]
MNQSPPPFFVVGFQRSGTTLLRVMLNAHPKVAIPLDVTGMWWRFEQQLDRFGDLTQDVARRALVAAVLDEPRIKLWGIPLAVEGVLRHWTAPGYPGAIAAFYLEYAAHYGKTTWGDKDPGNTKRIDVLDRWFPGCRLIHIVRDGRGACLSHLSQSFGHDDLMACAEAWREEVWWVRRMGHLLGASRYHELKYEDLVTNPREVLGAVCGFLGIDYSEQMLSYPESIDESVPAEKRHIWPLIGQSPQAKNALKWREEMPAGVQVCFEKRAGEALVEFGYPTSSRPWSGQYATELGFLVGRLVRAVRARLRRR